MGDSGLDSPLVSPSWKGKRLGGLSAAMVTGNVKRIERLMSGASGNRQGNSERKGAESETQ